MRDKWEIARKNDRAFQIKNELVQLLNEQTEFFRKGGRMEHTKSEIADYEKRCERVRALFAELEQVKKSCIAFPFGTQIYDFTPSNVF
jgi:hypothetical protein